MTLIQKIRALLAKTTAAGCTEAEAFAAAALARRLMDAHNLSPSALDDAEEDPWATETTSRTGAERARGKRRTAPRAFAFRDLIYGAVGRYCDCVGIRSPTTDTIRFHGRASDVLFATWLLETLDALAFRAFAAHDAAAALSGDAALSRPGFLTAYAERLAERLRAEGATRPQPGAAIVPVSRAILARQHALELWPHISWSGTKVLAAQRSNADIAAGRAAADRASFHRPMGGASTARPKLLT